jgi:hypothetical protein
MPSTQKAPAPSPGAPDAEFSGSNSLVDLPMRTRRQRESTADLADDPFEKLKRENPDLDTDGVNRALSLTAIFARCVSGDPRDVNDMTARICGGTIPEAASKKRGRPRVIHEWFESYCRDHFPHVVTARGRQNLKYMYLAIDVLDLDPDGGAGLEKFGWLLDWKSADRHRKGAIKSGILAELGRIAAIYGVEFAAEAAAAMCEVKPSVKEGIAKLRRMRLKHRSGREDFDAWRDSKRDDQILLTRLARVIDQYRAEHPEMSLESITDVIGYLWRTMSTGAP